MSKQRCSFCQKAESEVAFLIAKPDAVICDECVLAKKLDCSNPQKYVECKQYEKCTFCSFMHCMDKLPSFVRQFLPERSDSVRVVGGPQVWICQQCLDLCEEIIAEQKH